MRIRTRLILALCIAVIIPSTMVAIMVQVFSVNSHNKHVDASIIERTSSLEVMSMILNKPYSDIKEVISEDKELLENVDWLKEFDTAMNKNMSFIAVKRNEDVDFLGKFKGTTARSRREIVNQLPMYGQDAGKNGESIYIGGEHRALVRLLYFKYSNGDSGTFYIVMMTDSMKPQVRGILFDLAVGVTIIIVFTVALLFAWVYKTIMKPIDKLQMAATSIKEGNLEFELDITGKDEIGDLSRNVDSMRKRLKENAKEKLESDKEYRELLRNISHDLRTPVTSIKGYAEGIMDGVANTPDKMDKYIKTVYNKAIDLDRLLDELTLYSKLESNRVPYEFVAMKVKDWVTEEEVEALRTELHSRNIEFEYCTTVDEEVCVWVDYIKIKRVAYNIVANAIQYMNKSNSKLVMRIKDAGAFVQVEFEDNGQGISTKDLPHIFDRFYRGDDARSTEKGGSGIGLSIAKRIVDEHGGKIWATSAEGVGTTIYYLVKKYQEAKR